MEKERSISSPIFTELLRAVFVRGVPFRFRAKGFSMSPFLRNGDVVTVAPIRSSSPEFGDVVAFTHPRTGRLIIHRVVGRRDKSYLMKGDNSSQMDGLVPAANLLGYVTRIERGQGKRVSLGLGPGRYAIALLTRGRLFRPLLLSLWSLGGPVVKMFQPSIGFLLRRIPGEHGTDIDDDGSDP